MMVYIAAFALQHLHQLSIDSAKSLQQTTFSSSALTHIRSVSGRLAVPSTLLVPYQRRKRDLLRVYMIIHIVTYRCAVPVTFNDNNNAPSGRRTVSRRKVLTSTTMTTVQRVLPHSM